MLNLGTATFFIIIFFMGGASLWLLWKLWIYFLVYLSESVSRAELVVRLVCAVGRAITRVWLAILGNLKWIGIYPNNAPYRQFIQTIHDSLSWSRQDIRGFLESYKNLEKLPTVRSAMNHLGMRSIFDYYWRYDRLLARKTPYVQKYQRPYIFIPGPRGSAFFSKSIIPETVSILEKNFSTIRDEYLAACEPQNRVFKNYINESGLDFDPMSQEEDHGHLRYSRGDWQVIFFWRGGIEDPYADQICPKTKAILKTIPDLDDNMVCFSKLAPHRWIPPHVGLTNAVLRVHLPLVVPGECQIKVGDQTHQWREGELVVFDDSFQHEVWNSSNSPRGVLLLNVIHPDFSPSERENIKEFFSVTLPKIPPHRLWRER